MTQITNNTEYRNAVNTLKVWDNEYWNLNAPTVSDEVYDELLLLVQSYERQHPEETLPYSPTQALSTSTNGNGRRQVQRITPMLSTEKVDDLQKWTKSRIKAAFKAGVTETPLFAVEWKYDGDSFCIVYYNGKIVESSYGKGMQGSDVLKHALLIPGIPHTIDMQGRVEIRGEVICPKANLKNTGYKTCRSAASAYLANQTADPRLAKEMMFLPYYMESEVLGKCGEYNTFRALNKLGFIVDEPTLCEAKDLQTVVDEMKDLRDGLPFPVDGVVIKLDDQTVWSAMGATDHHPKYSCAYKYPCKKVETTLLYIDRGPKGSPIAHFTPTDIDGTIVSQATLSTDKCMHELGLTDDSKNVRVIIGLAKEVIPHVFEVLDTPIREVIG